MKNKVMLIVFFTVVMIGLKIGQIAKKEVKQAFAVQNQAFEKALSDLD